jgi:hypothetical protein
LIEVTLRKSGQAVVSGRLRVSDAPLATVSFEFESDQTYLMSTRDQLKRVATEFPVVTQVRDPAAERETE